MNFAEMFNDVVLAEELTDAGRAEAGFHNERDDCIVRAIALAYNMPYAEAHVLCESFGRAKNTGLDVPRIRLLLESLAAIALEYDLVGRTVYTFRKRYCVGTYILLVDKHIFCVRDGKILDEIIGLDPQIVLIAWKVA